MKQMKQMSTKTPIVTWYGVWCLAWHQHQHQLWTIVEIPTLCQCT